MSAVCRNTQKKIVFLLGREDDVGENKHHWVWFLLGQHAGQLNSRWSIEDKERVVDELMVETAMVPFGWHELGETGPDSLTVKITDLFPEDKNPRRLLACTCDECGSWHAARRFQIFMAGTRCEEEAQRIRVAEVVHQEENGITRCCTFLMNTFPEEIALIVSLSCIKPDWKKTTEQRLATFVLSFAILMKPQSHYNISQINTDHKHDMDDPPRLHHFTKNWPSAWSTMYLYIYIYKYLYVYFLHFKILVLWEHSKQTYSWINHYRSQLQHGKYGE